MPGTTGVEQKRFQRGVAMAASLVLGGMLAAGATGCSSNAPAKAGSRSKASARAASDQVPRAADAAVPTTPTDKGRQLFLQSCSNCHGMDGQGVPSLGADLRTDKFVAKSTDAQVVDLIEHGVPASDPRNTNHIPMPPKGANPSLTTRDIHDIVSYLRQLRKEEKSK